MKHIRILYKYNLHFFSARNTFGFGIHSPFLYQLTRTAIYDKNAYYIFPRIEAIRSELKKDNNLLSIRDFGTGKDKKRKVAEIAATSLKSAKYGQMLYKVARFCKSREILELGTSFGLTTAYLASSSPEIHCISLEGCEKISTVANRNFEKLQLKNIQIVVGNIDLTLPRVLNDCSKLDLIFIDANHRMPAIYNYFEQCLTKINNESVIIIDDIYWSDEMGKAWEMIKNHPRVTTTFDLFQLGIVFFRSDLHKKHYKLRY
jgi:predicted O-methyltransferase YrrM